MHEIAASTGDNNAGNGSSRDHEEDNTGQQDEIRDGSVEARNDVVVINGTRRSNRGFNRVLFSEQTVGLSGGDETNQLSTEREQAPAFEAMAIPAGEFPRVSQGTWNRGLVVAESTLGFSFATFRKLQTESSDGGVE